MTTGLLHSHTLCVILFTFIYLVKTILLLSDKNELLEKFKKKTKILEMIVSFGFLATGIALLFIIPGSFNRFMIIKITLILISIPLAVIGYKNKNKVLATLSFFLIVVTFFISKKAKETIVVSDIQVISLNGKEIYNDMKCASCHGDNGKLGLVGAKDLSATQLTHAEIVDRITNGKTPMAPYKSVLSAEQIEAVANYVENDLRAK